MQEKEFIPHVSIQTGVYNGVGFVGIAKSWVFAVNIAHQECIMRGYIREGIQVAPPVQ